MSRLDPTLGNLHARHPGRVALAHDLMEPLRPKVDGMVLEFVQQLSFAPGDFTLGREGACRLHPQLAKTIASRMIEASAVQGVIERPTTVPRGQDPA